MTSTSFESVELARAATRTRAALHGVGETVVIMLGFVAFGLGARLLLTFW